MKYLRIKNTGSLDFNLIPLMGGTTKEGLDTIGEFGTGLKYCLAYFIRNNIEFHLIINNEKVKIEAKEQKVANQDFKIIYINDEKTSITHKMGKDWKAWMIIREIYSNALDEGDAFYEVVNEIKEEEQDTTVFYIELNAELIEVVNNWTKYFIHSKTPMWENNRFKVYPEQGKLKLYKQGILIYEDSHVDSIFNYDIANADLNELREYQGIKGMDIQKCLLSINDTKVIEYFLEQVNLNQLDKLQRMDKVKDLYEESMNFDWGGEFGDIWKEVLGDTKVIDAASYDRLKDKTDFDLSMVLIVSKGLFKKLTSKFEFMGAVRTLKQVGSFFEIMSDTLFQKVKEARKILEDCGYFIHPELNIIFGEFGDKNVQARVDLDAKTIYISNQMENKSLFTMITVLIEENEHFQTGFHDETRQFQQHWIDLYANTLLAKNGVKL